MDREDAIALVRQLIESVGRRDLDGVVRHYADDAVAISPMFGEVRGRENIAATWKVLFSTFFDVRLDISDILVDGNRVAVLSSLGTTDRAGWFGLPPTGGRITYRLILLMTIAGGRIVRDERIYDSSGVMERLEKARIDKELRTAADVQRTLLSRTTHDTPFCRFSGDSVPCRAIGGDFFEFADLPSGDVGVAMGDVAGKGPAAALLAAMIQGMFAVESSVDARPGAMLERINRRLAARRLEARFATLAYGVITHDGSLVYSNAGHNPPVLVTADGVRRLTAGGPILGVFGDADFEEQTVPLHPDDLLVMFTDGVTEARSAAGEEFGDERLLACLAGDRSPDATLKRIFSSVRDFAGGAELADDVTVTVTRWNG